MAEQTFRSPGFFEKEIDLSARKVGPVGTPAGIVGTAEYGPAFVPVTVGSFADFQTRFGGLSPNRFGPYAVREFLKHRTAVTYMRVLGAGANDTMADVSNTNTQGTVKNAGIAFEGTDVDANPSNIVGDGRHAGVTQYLCAQHFVSGSEGSVEGYPTFTDNDSFDSSASDLVNIVRAIIMTPTGSRVMVMNGDESWTGTGATLDDYCELDNTPLKADGVTPNRGHNKTFKLVISSSTGQTFAEDDGNPGLRIMTASLDPNHSSYVGKILNRDPHKFQILEHYLYADFAVEHELAPVLDHSTAVGGQNGVFSNQDTIAILSGTRRENGDCPIDNLTLREQLGRFDTRYTTPSTPWVISQPFGGTEYPLFRFETLSDGEYANDKYKVSIANLRASTDPNDKHPTFEVQIRRFSDTDMNKEMVERYPECSLNPKSDRFIARLIGDYKVKYDFDADNEDERRLLVSGKYPNRSHVVRVVVSDSIYHGDPCIPAEVMPFGFQGIKTLKTSDSLTDHTDEALMLGEEQLGDETTGNNLVLDDALVSRLGAAPRAGGSTVLTGSIVPPLPMRFKCTRNSIKSSQDGTIAFVGESGVDEKADSRLYWGVKFERMPRASTISDAVMNTNVSSLANPMVAAHTKFMGIEKLDSLVTGSGADTFNNNKFTLARVALSERPGTENANPGDLLDNIDSTSKSHMLNAAYIRNGVPDASKYTLVDTVSGNNRITMATLVHNSAVVFNRFTDFAKFTMPFSGGWNGLNFLDRDNAYMNDRASSSDQDGCAQVDFTDDGLGGTDLTGEGKENNIVNSYNVAVSQMTDPMTVNTNILCIPGIRDSFVTDYAADRTRDYSKAIYLMDIPTFSEKGTRIFIDSSLGSGNDEKPHSQLVPDVRTTSEEFEGRAIDNNYCATYFPDVYIDDPLNNLKVKVPASVPAIAALGYNDKVSYPWFAPAGFNRGALGFVTNVATRLSTGDRDTLYDARINPIAVFPNGGFVIFGQKTLQMNKSALDRVNVRRMLLEVKRLIVGVANRILFEQNTPQTRARFIGSVVPLLALVQAQAGIEKFQVIMDDTNNSVEDYENNRLNGRIVVVPTRAIEFIAIDFIITNSGVMFE